MRTATNLLGSVVRRTDRPERVRVADLALYIVRVIAIIVAAAGWCWTRAVLRLGQCGSELGGCDVSRDDQRGDHCEFLHLLVHMASSRKGNSWRDHYSHLFDDDGEILQSVVRVHSSSFG